MLSSVPLFRRLDLLRPSRRSLPSILVVLVLSVGPIGCSSPGDSTSTSIVLPYTQSLQDTDVADAVYSSIFSLININAGTGLKSFYSNATWVSSVPGETISVSGTNSYSAVTGYSYGVEGVNMTFTTSGYTYTLSSGSLLAKLTISGTLSVVGSFWTAGSPIDSQNLTFASPNLTITGTVSRDGFSSDYGVVSDHNVLYSVLATLNADGSVNVTGSIAGRTVIPLTN